MLTKKYTAFQKEVKKQIKNLKKKKKITESDFDSFVKKILSKKSLDLENKLYCRDGFVFVHQLDHNTFQILAFQINSFGAGIFDKSMVKLCTPIMLTITAHGTHRYLQHSLKDTCVSIDEFYLGTHYSGSKGPLCKRNKFNSYAKLLLLSKDSSYSFNHHMVYHIMNANYLCHHISEVLGYAFGAIDSYWKRDKNLFFLASCSWFDNDKSRLYVNIIENFSDEKMSSHFQIPHYEKLAENVEKFKEEYDNLLCSISYKEEVETFYLPIGYQKIRKKRFHKNINVITSQHILEHLLSEYYQRSNTFVVTNSFQTLEYLSRALLAKTEGKEKEFKQYMGTVTSCMGYNPDRDFENLIKKKEAKYPVFETEFSHSMFFRAPVLK
jgi:hypothetical protein